MKRKVFFLDEDRKVRRDVSGELINVLDVNYYLPLDQLQKQLNIALRKWLKSKPSLTLTQRIKIFLSKGLVAHKHNNCIEVVAYGIGALDLLKIEEHYAVKDKFAVTFSHNLHNPIAYVVPHTGGNTAVANRILTKLAKGSCVAYIQKFFSQIQMDILSDLTKDNPLIISLTDDGFLRVEPFTFDGFGGVLNEVKKDLPSIYKI